MSKGVRKLEIIAIAFTSGMMKSNHSQPIACYIEYFNSLESTPHDKQCDFVCCNSIV